ncbi:hypothetical protein QCA50_012486 [Cerrena zonata]|uniref:DUF6534 domain-containing protein n=1 Tax=Cerrena zonata TaxID=2478898 RepID=A0AAW0FYM6_9APHY
MATQPSVTHLFGPFIESLGISYLLYGIGIAQACIYFVRSEHDSKWMRRITTVLIIFETAHTAVLFRTLYVYSVMSIDNPALLADMDWSVPTALAISIPLETIVHLFYIYRIWTFGRSYVMAIIPIIIYIFRNGWFFYTVIEIIMHPTWEAVHTTSMKRAFICFLSSDVLVDIFLASGMVYHLGHSWSRFKRTQSVLYMLMIYAINTGVIFAVTNSLALITYLTKGDTLYFAAFLTINSKLYANSFLGLANMRRVLRKKMDTPIIIGTNEFSTRRREQGMEMTPVGVEITQETLKVSDSVHSDVKTSRYDLSPRDMSVMDTAVSETHTKVSRNSSNSPL